MQKARRHPKINSGLRPLVSVWFQVLFTLLLAVLFTFPSRYLFAIGLSGVFSLTGWYRLIHTKFHWLRATQDTATFYILQLRDYHPLWSVFPHHSFSIQSAYAVLQPHTYKAWFGLFRVRSPLLTESFSYFLLLRVLRCFSSPRFIPFGYMVFNHVGCPIRTSTGHRLFAPHHSLSQLIASFVFSESLGIPHTLLFAFCSLKYTEIYFFSFLSLYCYLLLACMSINFFLVSN